MRRTATELAKILGVTKWPADLIPTAIAEIMAISGGDNSFTHTLSNGVTLAGLFGIETGGVGGYSKGQLWAPLFNSSVALDMYNRGDKWLEFWLSIPVSRLQPEIDKLARHLQLGQPTARMAPRHTPGGKIGRGLLF